MANENWRERTGEQRPPESHESPDERPTETWNPQSEGSRIIGDTRSQIDRTIPGILKKD